MGEEKRLKGPGTEEPGFHDAAHGLVAQVAIGRWPSRISTKKYGANVLHLSMVVLILTMWALAGSDHANALPVSRTFAVGDEPLSDAASYPNLIAFRNAVKCVRPGDRILLQQGKVFQGPLQLTVCADSAKDAAIIEVRGFNPTSPLDAAMVRSPATIEAAIDAHALGLIWKKQRSDELPAAMSPPQGNLAIYKLAPLGQDVAELFYAGKRLPLARMPSLAEQVVAARYVRTTQITSNQNGCAAIVCLHFRDAPTLHAVRRAAVNGAAVNVNDMVGELYAVIRNSPWSIARSNVAGADVNTGEVRLSQLISGPSLPAESLPSSGYGFILLNSPAFLDSRGEWYFDRANRTLYLMWDKTDPPAAKETQITYSTPASADKSKHEDAALSVWGNAKSSGDSYQVDISHLTIRHSAAHGLRVLNVPNLRVAHLTVEQPRESGIAVHGVIGRVEIASSTVVDAPGNGITVSSAKIVRIEGNRLSNLGQIANQTQYGMEFNGIRASGFQTAYIARNSVARVGYAGLMLSDPPAASGDAAQPLAIDIVDNVISDFCRLLNDCGAIYINKRLNASNKETTSPGTIRRISGNEISLPGGNLDGAPGLAMPAVSSNPTSGAYVRMVGAVYLDHSASNFDVHGNKVAGKYEPYGWRVFNKGLFNACNRQEMIACGQTKAAYQCYTQGLDKCNSVSRE
jgi:hypothetical protein